jgi:molybdate transport system substrate-binding protein
VRRLIAALLAFAAAIVARAEPAPLTIAAAANLSDCIAAIDAEFLKHNPDAQLKVSTGSSGNFYAQIRNGAPYDVFVSADMDYPKRLAADGQARPETLRLYAYGQLVLWTMRDDVDLSRGLAVLTTPAVRTIAIANPDVAPYGRAAQAALEKAGLWESVRAKLVRGENISQTAQFVQSGNADAGFVALSLLKSPATLGLGRIYLLPAGSHPPLEQGAIVTQHGADNPLAKRYLDFLGSPAARTIFSAYGYTLPPPSTPH